MIVEFSVVGWAIVRVMGCAIINPEILGTRDSLIFIFELQARPAIHFVCFANGHLLYISTVLGRLGWTHKSVVMVCYGSHCFSMWLAPAFFWVSAEDPRLSWRPWRNSSPPSCL